MELPPPTGKQEALARASELELLYWVSFPAVFASLLAAGLAVALLWPVQNHRLLLEWLAVIVVTVALRAILFLRYFRIRPSGKELLGWERPYAMTLALAGTAWGFGALLIMPQHSELHQVALLLLLVGMSGSAVGVYSPRRGMMLMVVALLMLPSFVWVALRGGQLFFILLVATGTFLFTIWRSSAVFSRYMHRAFLFPLELEDARVKAERMARQDQLTGLDNRRALYEAGRRLMENRRGESTALILFDLDHFKKINDTYGHANGDLVLRHVAKVLSENLRSDDVAARIGGEEFAVLLRVSRREAAESVARKLREKLAESPVTLQGEYVGTGIHVTASFGVAFGRHLSLDQLLQQADKALYEAKDKGRNQVVMARAAV